MSPIERNEPIGVELKPTQEVVSPAAQESAVDASQETSARPQETHESGAIQKLLRRAKTQDDQKQQTSQAMTPIEIEVKKDVEQILAEDLGALYQQMNPEQRAAFKQKGQEVSIAISKLLTRAQATFKSVLKLVRDWLSMIPSTNKLFLEQESKIKTDSIIKYGIEQLPRKQK